MLMKVMLMMVTLMMACSILSSHANHVNPNQCGSSRTHKSFGNREICNRRKREICIFKTEKYALKKSKVQRRQACVLSREPKVHLTTRSNFVKLQSDEILRSIVTVVVVLLSSSNKIWRHNLILVIVITYHGNYHRGNGHYTAIGEWQGWEGLPHYTESVMIVAPPLMYSLLRDQPNQPVS